MAGIWTSATTHDASYKWADRKNSSAEANVWTVYPSDLRRLSVATRTDTSSSTTEITGCLDTMVFPSRRNREPIVADRRMGECAANRDRKIIHRFYVATASRDGFRAFRRFSPDRPTT